MHPVILTSDLYINPWHVLHHVFLQQFFCLQIPFYAPYLKHLHTPYQCIKPVNFVNNEQEIRRRGGNKFTKFGFESTLKA